jgi:hypothetical protein
MAGIASKKAFKALQDTREKYGKGGDKKKAGKKPMPPAFAKKKTMKTDDGALTAFGGMKGSATRPY